MKTTAVNQPRDPNKGRYYDLMSYFGFEKIFNQDGYKYFHALIDAICVGEPRLRNFRYTNVFEYVKTQKPLRIYKYDISCDADPKTIITAERLGYKDEKFSARNSARLAWLMARSFDPEVSVAGYNRIISLNIANFVEWEGQEEYVDYSRMSFSDSPLATVVWEVTIEVPKFNKTLEELETDLDKWIYLLRNMPNLDKRPAQFDTPIFKELFEEARLPR